MVVTSAPSRPCALHRPLRVHLPQRCVAPRRPADSVGSRARAERVVHWHDRHHGADLVAVHDLRSVGRGGSITVAALRAWQSGRRRRVPHSVRHRAPLRCADHIPLVGWHRSSADGRAVRPQNRQGARETKTFPVDIPMDVTDRVRGGGIAVPTPYLALESAKLVALLAIHAGRPRRQAHLGTCRSLEWQPWSPSAATFHRKDRQTRPWSWRNRRPRRRSRESPSLIGTFVTLIGKSARQGMSGRCRIDSPMESSAGGPAGPSRIQPRSKRRSLRSRGRGLGRRCGEACIRPRSPTNRAGVVWRHWASCWRS